MEKYRALIARENSNGCFTHSIEERNINELPENDVLIKVHYSGLNYKDALSSSGNKGVTRNYPHQPGIDASGIVVESKSEQFKDGDEVLVTGYDMGMNTAGGFGEYIRVPAGWVVPRPEKLNLKECMIYGTAGFTVALGIEKMLRMGQKPEDGEIVVTGASGGVGSIAVGVFAKLGFDVIASTGKENAHDFLRKLGAIKIVGRDEVTDDSGKPLIKPKWAGAYDTVGGNILETVIKATKVHGSIATCGNALSYKLNTTVFPFILNGVNLLGVNSATAPMDLRSDLWDKLANDWRMEGLHDIPVYITLDELSSNIDKILKGSIIGRCVVKVNSEQ